jgi:hypothetical protein
MILEKLLCWDDDTSPFNTFISLSFFLSMEQTVVYSHDDWLDLLTGRYWIFDVIWHLRILYFDPGITFCPENEANLTMPGMLVIFSRLWFLKLKTRLTAKKVTNTDVAVFHHDCVCLEYLVTSF